MKKTVEVEIKVQNQNGGLNWDELFVYETLTFELTTYEETYKKVSEKVQELANDWNLQTRWNYKGQLQGYYVKPF